VVKGFEKAVPETMKASCRDRTGVSILQLCQRLLTRSLTSSLWLHSGSGGVISTFRGVEVTRGGSASQGKDHGAFRGGDAELHTFLQLEHIMRLAKARAHQYLAHE